MNISNFVMIPFSYLLCTKRQGASIPSICPGKLPGSAILRTLAKLAGIAVMLLPLLVFTFLPLRTDAQIIATDSYEIDIAPDIWFNSVDGIIAGVRFRGEDPRTFLDGPHRIHAGIWLGTRFPDHPVSYAFSWAHPVAAITGINSEGGLRFFSSMRTGLHLHETGLQKRWQPGFDEFVSSDFGVRIGFYKRFDEDYLLYDALWQTDPVVYLRSSFRKRDRNALGRWTLALQAMSGMPVTDDDPYIDFTGRQSMRPEELGQEGLFGRLQLELMQQIDMPSGFQIRTRLFGGISSAGTPPEHRFLSSDAAAFDWHDSALTRARGTIPTSWMRSGWVQVPGGPGLRGYTFQTTSLLEAGLPAWSQHALSFNLDFYFPNPLNRYFARIPYAGDLLKLESYLFADAGYLDNGTGWQDPVMDAGAGLMLSLNIPDYLGQDRGFFIRYELPLWLSEPEPDENGFEIRHLLGLGILFRM